MSILTYIFGLPLLAALALIFVPRERGVIIRTIAVLATLVSYPARTATSSSSRFRG
jgi:hypothetical protein